MAELDALREKVKWRARRGLLENDLFFQRFAEQRLDSLSEAQLLELLDLLTCDDHELWAMLSGKVECEVTRWQPMVSLLRQCAPDVTKENRFKEGNEA
jgi:succinate dehydrogenase flavin-adding protein (antitoxin of CptAB toxin-antitoxin module)